jgi:signal transduction histidine kinase/ActR/RegA family two-component response regulator
MFGRLPIRLQVLVAPLVVMLLCIGVAVGSVLLLRAQGEAFREVVGGAFDTASTASRVSLAVAGIHSDVIRHIDLVGAQQSKESLVELREQLPRRFDVVESMLHSIETNAGSVVDADRLHAIGELLAVYRVVATRVTQMQALNPTLVSSLVAHYSQLNSYLGELSAIATREAKRKQERTEAFVARSVSILMGVVAASLALGLLATWLIGRAISTPLTDMTRVMSRLAQGDYEISVPAMERRDEVGSMAQAVEVFRQASQRLSQHDAELAQMVEHLAVMRDQAAEASRAKSAFLASMSHELRTPLNAILGYAQILKWNQGLTDKQLTGLNTIEQAGQHLLALIDEVLDLSKIEAGRLELHNTPVQLAPFLDGIVNIIRVRVEQRGVRFLYQSAGLPAAALADERRLRQVLLNLLGNAAKFTDQGEVCLLVSAEPEGEGHVRVRFEVQDSGVGISEADLRALFQAFQQVGDTQRRRGGTGLGLAISRQLVRHMGGDIHVTSEPGRGSLFWFELVLPLVPAETAKPPERVAVGYEGERKTVLVVDDVPQNRTLLIDMLRPLGFSVVEAQDGRDGLERAKALQPDLILMDNVMPVMDGLEATRRLREVPALQGVPVFSISASAGIDGPQRALEAGANAFLTKPFRAAQLLELMEQHMRIRFIHRG